MKYLIANILLLTVALTARAELRVDSLLKVLDQTIAQRDAYEQEKLIRIDFIKRGLQRTGLTDADRYNIYDYLYQEYEAYISDSARHYVGRSLEVATALGNAVWINDSKIKKAKLLSTAGLYPQAVELLQSIDKTQLAPEALAEYYLAFEHTYLYQVEYVAGDEVMGKYLGLMYTYRDSALMVLPENSYRYTITRAPQLIDAQKTLEAEALLLAYLSKSTPGTRNYSVLTSILAFVYECTGNNDLRKVNLIKSATSDVQAVVKENNSLRALSEMLYMEGQVERADRYVKISLEDANFYNARLRNIQASKMLPIIDTAYRLEKEHQNRKLRRLLLIISIMSVFLLAAVIYVISQMRKLSKARRQVMTANGELHKLNAELREANLQKQITNNSLTEANYVKEEYIGRFLGLCSAYIDKMESYRRMLNKKAGAGKVDDLYKTLKSTRFIEDELKEFYRNFDASFLNIYPDFVSSFNKLLPEDEQILPKQDESLTTELRIFALIRLGINDSSKIAEFLRYSITTIYTYRSKMKNKSLHKDSFEEKVMEIGTFRRAEG